MDKRIFITLFCVLLSGPCAASLADASGVQALSAANLVAAKSLRPNVGEGVARFASLEDRNVMLSRAGQARIAGSAVISVLLCLCLFQLMVSGSPSRQHHALTALVLAALAFESVRYAGWFFGTTPHQGLLSRLLPAGQCLLAICAIGFTDLLFNVKTTHPRLHDISRAGTAMLAIVAAVSLTGTRISEDLARVLVWFSIGLIGAVAAAHARSSNDIWHDFMLASLPLVLGGVLSAALPVWSPDIHLPWSAADLGLAAALSLLVTLRARRVDHERHEQEDSLLDTQRRYRLALEGSNDGIFEWDMSDCQVFASRRAHEITGIDYVPGWRPEKVWREQMPADELERLSGTSEALVIPDNIVRIETWMLDRRGDKLYLLVQGKLDLDEDGKPLRLIGSISDVSAQKRLEERLRHDALHDFLTGLPNRTLLTDRIERVAKRLRRNPESRAALLFIGLDNFKSINDNLGHGFGDQVLRSIADRLVEFVRASDTVARFGGDEFVILLEDMFSHREAVRFANRILTKIQSPLEIQHQHLAPSVSIGLTFVEDPNTSAETVLGDADIAMDAAKENGKGRVVAFDTTMRTRAAKRLELEGALHDAIENHELYLAYQPIFSLEANHAKPVGVEALLRWKRSDRTDIAPSELLSLAEENGMIEEIGKWVIRTTATQLASWRSAGYPDDFYININLSPVHFESDEIVSTILKEVDPLGVPRNALRLEIVETAVIRYPEKALSVIKLLQSQGILVAIDDFGTGFSSLSYLHRFPFHALKIDRSFVAEIVESKATRDIVTAIVVLARRLGIKVVAEGIENTAQLDFLKSVGCHLGQGYLLARPSESVDHLFAERSTGTASRESVRESTVPTDIAPQYQ